MMRTLLLVAVVLACLAPAHAQDRKPAASTKERIRRQILEMRRALREGRVIRTNVRVIVRLVNGNRIKGVVKNERFIERIRGLDFVPAQMQAPGAGLRVWYYDHTSSYIFLPFTEIRSYKIGARLTDVQVKVIEQRIKQTEAEALRRRERELARRRALAEGQGGEEPKKVGPGERAKRAKEAAQKKEQQRLLALLQEFPPAEGWGAEKVRRIQMRKITIGAFPDARSRRFLKVFDDWQKAVKLQAELDRQREEQAEPTEQTAEPGKDGKMPGATPPRGSDTGTKGLPAPGRPSSGRR